MFIYFIYLVYQTSKRANERKIQKKEENNANILIDEK